MKRYEGLFILNTAGKEETLKDTIDKISAEIVSGGGKVETVQKMDKKTFSRVADRKRLLPRIPSRAPVPGDAARLRGARRQQGGHLTPGFAHLGDQSVDFLEDLQIIVDIDMQQAPNDVAIQFIEVGGQLAPLVEV